MWNDDFLPRAFSGGLLYGDRAVRFIYLDEAGNEKKTKYHVVAGVMVHADHQLFLAERSFKEHCGAAPVQFIDGFRFHCKDIWNNKDYRSVWTQSDRLNMIKNVLRIPRRHGLQVLISSVPHDFVDLSETANKIGVEQHQYLIMLGYNSCLQLADRYIREFGDPRECGFAIVEDEPDIRRHIQNLHSGSIRSNDSLADLETKKTPSQENLGYNPQTIDYRTTRIREAIHFAEKDKEIMLGIADACAFSVRRWLNDEPFGDELFAQLLGPNRSKDKKFWQANPSNAIFSFPFPQSTDPYSNSDI